MKRLKYALLSGTLSASMACGLSATLWTPTAYAGGTAIPTTTINGQTWYEVSTAAQLEAIDSNQNLYLSANIELTNDIKMPSGFNWTPLGGQTSGVYSVSSPEAPFSGEFNGHGHEISGLTITDNSDLYVGFFGETTGTIENLGIDATVSAVTINAPSAGGFVGDIEGGSISNSYATGSVKGSGFTGGFVGRTHGGNISNSYATGSVNGVAYSIVSPNGGGFVGGIISGSISNSYATGHVTVDGFAGGFVGSAIGGSNITGSYFDKDTTGQTSSGASGGVTGETTTIMQTPSTFTNAGWSTSKWALYKGQYPLLSWQVPLTISMSATPKTVGAAGKVTVTGSVYSSKGTPLSGIHVTLSDNVAGSWLHASVMTDASGQFTDTWTAPSSTATATLTASVDGASVQNKSTIQVQAYTITYKGNGNSGGTVPTDNNTYTRGMSATVLGNTSTLTKTGYTFAGWNTQPDGKGTSYLFGSKLTVGTTNVTLYGKWRVDPSISTSSRLPNVLEGTAYNQELQGAGGVSPYTFSVTSGSLPNGLRLQSDGSLVGTPQQSGTFDFTVQIKDKEGISTTNNMSLYVIPTAPTGYLKTVTTNQIVGDSGGTLTAKSSRTTATLVISSGTFTNPLQMDITTGTVPSNLVPSGWNMVAAYGVNFDTNDSPTHPLSFTMLNQGITPQSKVYKIVNGELVPVTATVSQGKAVVSFTTDPDFVVLQPKPVPQATKPVTGFPAFPWAAGGLLSMLTGGLALWWQKRRKTHE